MNPSSDHNVIYRGTADSAPRVSWAVPPPGGATFASFILFASLAALTAIAYAGSEWMSLNQGFGFPTDLAWVRLVFARAVAGGHGAVFNAGPPVAGIAAPSWVAAVGLLGLFSGEFVIAAKLLGVLAVMLSSFFVWGIVLRMVDDWRFAFLAALLVVINPLLGSQALGGTEAPFAAMLVLAAIHWQGAGWEGGRGLRIAAALAIGLAALTRPELFLLLPLVLLDRWIIAAVHAQPGRRLSAALLWSFPEATGAALVTLPYVLYNLHLGGFWQRPEVELHPLAPLAWTKVVLAVLWTNAPVLLVLAAFGIAVVAMSASRARAGHPSFLLLLIPMATLLLPGFIWPDVSPQAAALAAAYLMPVVVVLAVSGLMLPYRLLQSAMERARVRAVRLPLGALLGLAVIGLCGASAWRQATAWREYGDQVKRIANLQVELGEWAGQHLPPDASIASRQIGSIGYFSKKRMVDLSGTVDTKGLSILRRPGAFDSNLLAFLREAQPSHLAIRAGEIPDLAQRPDILVPVTSRTDVDRTTQGQTTLTLYETEWKPPSVRAVEAVER